jgi:hypothetical protein
MAWAPRVADSVIDNGLASLKSAGRYVYICSDGLDASTNPTHTEVTSTYDLGSKDLTAGGVIPGAIAAATGGRKVTTASISDGSVTDNGTAQFWAITDGSNVLAVGDLSGTQAVTSGNTFSLGAFDITIKYQ